VQTIACIIQIDAPSLATRFQRTADSEDAKKGVAMRRRCERCYSLPCACCNKRTPCVGAPREANGSVAHGVRVLLSNGEHLLQAEVPDPTHLAQRVGMMPLYFLQTGAAVSECIAVPLQRALAHAIIWAGCQIADVHAMRPGEMQFRQ
jgi:hypothetical protein